MSGLSHGERPQVTAERDAGIQHVWQVSGRRVCVCRGVTERETARPHALRESDPVYMMQLQTRKPCSRHPLSTNILGLRAYLIRSALASYSKLLAHSLFLPPRNSAPLPLLALSDFSVIQLSCHFFGRQDISPEIQHLPSSPETAVTK